mgnify:CR=1 FL=1
MSSTASATAAAPAGYSEDVFEAFLKERDEPGWLVDRRREAYARLQAFAWPTLRDEEWRRTNIRAFKPAEFGPPKATEPSAAARAAFDPLWEKLATHYGAGVAHVDGLAVRKADPSKLGGAILVDLDAAVRDHPEILKEHLLTDVVKPSDDVIAAWHAAFWRGGTLLYVPRGVKVETPLFDLVGLSGEARADFSHTLVVLEEDAEAAFVRETASVGRDGAPGLHVGALEVVQKARSKFRLVNVQDWDLATWNFGRERALIAADASIQWTIGALGSRLSKVNQEVVLTGRGADAQVNGVMFATGSQHLAYLTRQDHQAPHTTSDLLYKGGLKDSSRIVWRGMIRVEKDAQRTDGFQRNDNLVLSDAARSDSIPGLEIEADDVRCTHGATAGRVDEDMVFFCQARGIPRATAVRLIVEGFFANVYDRVALEPARETLAAAVAAKLGES